jgi:hypothetical protein
MMLVMFQREREREGGELMTDVPQACLAFPSAFPSVAFLSNAFL